MPTSSRRKSKPSLRQLVDENFACLHRVALAISETLRRPTDRRISRSTLAELANFHKSESIDVKRNVRKFLRFYLTVLRWTQTHQPIRLYDKWYANETKIDGPMVEQEEMHIWLEPDRSYLAMKHFDDGSTMIYSAVTQDGNNGWMENGMKALNSHVTTTELT